MQHVARVLRTQIVCKIQLSMRDDTISCKQTPMLKLFALKFLREVFHPSCEAYLNQSMNTFLSALLVSMLNETSIFRSFTRGLCTGFELILVAISMRCIDLLHSL